MTTTEYVVLSQTTVSDAGGQADVWLEHATVTAVSSTAAIRASSPSETGTYVAIPKRSFQPVQIEVETTPRVKIVG